MFENRTIATLGPEGATTHSVHCLIDVPQCVASPFEILLKHPNATRDDFIRGWRLEEGATKDAVVSLAMREGVCTDCVGTGSIARALHIGLDAVVVDVGTAYMPPTIRLADTGVVGTTTNLRVTDPNAAWQQAHCGQAGSDYPPPPDALAVGDEICVEGYLMVSSENDKKRCK